MPHIDIPSVTIAHTRRAREGSCLKLPQGAATTRCFRNWSMRAPLRPSLRGPSFRYILLCVRDHMGRRWHLFLVADTARSASAQSQPAIFQYPARKCPPQLAFFQCLENAQKKSLRASRALVHRVHRARTALSGAQRCDMRARVRIQAP